MKKRKLKIYIENTNNYMIKTNTFEDVNLATSNTSTAQKPILPVLKSVTEKDNYLLNFRT
jgi:hypothetical protein